jgi:uncharacterized protein YlaI
MVKCPICEHEFEGRPLKEWTFRNYAVERYLCPTCGEKFNLYIGEEKTFTIPKGRI